MTTRELYTATISALGSDHEELVSEFNVLLSKLDARNEKRKSSDTKEKKAVASRRDCVLGFLTSEPQIADDILVKAQESFGEDISIGQIRSALSALVKSGIATKAEVKVGKTRKMAYTLHTEG